MNTSAPNSVQPGAFENEVRSNNDCGETSQSHQCRTSVEDVNPQSLSRATFKLCALSLARSRMILLGTHTVPVGS